ncbi:hypothetical protein GCM10009733_042380 [Nonomuraea maheshkhaliensis]|uniref:Uncharacterized protein n=1 Tax=Nonomuraea maheshkhaliensis TaxID=419590 RepID=A0ABN2FCS3_9ACTN
MRGRLREQGAGGQAGRRGESVATTRSSPFTSVIVVGPAASTPGATMTPAPATTSCARLRQAKISGRTPAGSAQAKEPEAR